MSRKAKRSDTDPRQMTLFEVLQRLQEGAGSPARPGGMRVADTLRATMIEAIKRCPLSRWEIAGRMSALLDHEVSKYMLDAWVAESKEAHRFPAEYLPAFCEAAGSREPLRVLAEAAGMFALPGPEALRAEIQRLDEEAKKTLAEKHKRQLFLREMEKGRTR